MNCYYSNLIEGHDTHPVDIERALQGDYSHDAPKSGAILEAVLHRGELPRGDAAAIVGTGERQARRLVSRLIERGVLVADSSRAPLRLAFPARLASRWMPGLFPDRSA